MKSIQQSHRKLELDFTDATLTPMAGLVFVAQVARRLGLLEALDGFEPCKVRDHGASDEETVLASLGCLTSGAGKLRDLDELGEDKAACRAFGLERFQAVVGWANGWRGSPRRMWGHYRRCVGSR